MTLMFFQFNEAHWLRVRAAREAQGLRQPSELEKQRPEHRLVHANLRHHDTGQVWHVVSVRQEWQRGYYLVATLERDGVQQECVVENLSSCLPKTNIELARYLKGFQVLPARDTAPSDQN